MYLASPGAAPMNLYAVSLLVSGLSGQFQGVTKELKSAERDTLQDVRQGFSCKQQLNLI